MNDARVQVESLLESIDGGGVKVALEGAARSVEGLVAKASRPDAARSSGGRASAVASKVVTASRSAAQGVGMAAVVSGALAVGAVRVFARSRKIFD